MAAIFTDEVIKKVTEQCHWYPRNQFVLTADLKSKVLQNALAHIAPELRKEDVVAVRDDSFLRNGKVGWILTSDRIYFHKDYQLSSDPYHTHFIDISAVKSIRYKEKDSYVSLTFKDDRHDHLDCSIDSFAKQIYEFFACIIDLHNAGFYDDMFSNRNTALSLLHEDAMKKMQDIFPKYPAYVSCAALPEKQLVLLKKRLQNPFLEKIIAFDGNIDQTTAYGHLFTTEYYYFFSNGKLADHISLWELADVYPNHSRDKMTAILKDGTVKEFLAGEYHQDELDAIFEEIYARRHPSEPRGQHLRESTEEGDRRTRMMRKMNQLRRRDIPRPYEGKVRRELIALARKLEAAGGSEELPFVYEQIGFTSYPPEDSYFSAKCYLSMPLSRFSLSQVYYYLHCMKHNVRFCDDKIRCYENQEYRAFIEMCNTMPLTEVREKLRRDLNLCASWLKDANILNL